MTAPTVLMPGIDARERRSGGGGRGSASARRAMVRWAWRLFRREWRQQLLIVALITVAVGAVILGGAIATTTPSSPTAAFGTAEDMGILSAGRGLASEVATLRQKEGPVDVIVNEKLSVPGSIDTYDLRAQNPTGTYDRSLLALVSGRYPATAGEVAVAAGVASDFHLHVGALWHMAGATRRVVGIVENPTSLLDEFALVVPGQVTSPSAQATVLFDAHGPLSALRALGVLGRGNQFVSADEVAAQASNTLNPDTIMYALSTIGMLLIALVAIGGFTVLAQRRLRALGMVAAIGATERDVRSVVRANGVVTAVVGTVLGVLIGFGLWAAYRPHVEQSAHHVIGLFQLPWLVIVFAMVLAVVTTYLAAGRPARAVTRTSILAALSGRPAPLRQVRRSAVPGVVVLVVAFLLFSLSGANAFNGGGQLWLVVGIVFLIAAVVLLSPMCLALLGRLGAHAPLSARLALRDLARYRARSGSALAAITIGILIAVIVAAAAAARYGNYLDYTGANLAPNQMVIYSPTPPPGGTYFGPKGAPNPVKAQGLPSFAAQAALADKIARSVGASGAVELLQSSVALYHAAPGGNWNGQIYVATPTLLRVLGIRQSEINPNADFITMRPGIAGMSRMQMTWGNGPNSSSWNPVIQEISTLPAGTSAPNTLVTEHALATVHQKSYIAGWFIQARTPFTAAQIYNARQSAAAGRLTIETKSSLPTSAEVIDWATVLGIALALVILAMSTGLIRSEAAPDLRTLRATGASSFTHRTLTAATVGALGLTGAVLGTAAGYVALAGWFQSNPSNGGITALSSAPVAQLLVILIGMPLAAAAAGWLLAGREPSGLARQPIE